MQCSEKRTECAVRQLWIPFMSLITPWVPVAGLLRLLNLSCPLKKKGVQQNSFRVSVALEIPHTPRMGSISESCSCLHLFLHLSSFFSGCEPLMEVIDGFSRWGSSSASLREGGFSFLVCRHHPVNEKRTSEDSHASQARMQELEEGFVGDKSKKIV